MKLIRVRLLRTMGRALLVMMAFLVLAFLALPIVVVISVSFTETAFLRFPPQGFTLAWYREFLSDPSFLESIWLSFHLALAATVVALILGVSAALVLARFQFPGRNFINAFLLSPRVLPVIVIGVSILQFSAILGFPRTYIALLVGHVVIVLPYVVRAALASLTGMARSFEESAQDLGAKPLAVFFLVTLPQIKPGVVAGGVFAFIISWINVEVSIFSTSASLMPIPVKLFNYIQYSIDPMIAAVSAATIYVAIIAVIALDAVIGIDKAAAGR